MKKLIIQVILFVMMAAGISAIDYGLAREKPMEIGIVIDKVLMPPGTSFNNAKFPPEQYVIIVAQYRKYRGYYFSVPSDFYFDVSEGDRVPIKKVYGLITGWEYDQEILIN